VIHAAATLGFGVSNDEIDEVNRLWTKTIVDQSLASDVHKFIFISSVAALNRVNHQLVTEKDRFDFPENVGAYGKSKYRAEKEVWRGEAEGLDVIVFNPSQIIGLGHYDKINSQFLHYFEKLHRFYPKGGLGIVDVRDVADAIAIVLQNDDMWGKQFILNATNLSYCSFINEARSRMQLAPLNRPLPSWIHRYGHPFFAWYHWLKGKPNPFTKNYLRKLEYTFMYDNGKSLEIPGFAYREVEQTLDDWVASYFRTRGKSIGNLPP
jgi:nucleoside-diphosphate-sugar epimerase